MITGGFSKASTRSPNESFVDGLAGPRMTATPLPASQARAAAKSASATSWSSIDSKKP